MKKTYFGQTNDEYIQVAYAPTGRAKCKTCFKKIKDKELKIGNSRDNDHFIGKEWYHVTCFTLNPMYAELSIQNDVFGLQGLRKEDQDIITDYLNKQLQTFKDDQEKKTKKNKNTKGKDKSSSKQEGKSTKKVKQIEAKSQHSAKKSLKKNQQSVASQVTLRSKKTPGRKRRQVTPQKPKDQQPKDKKRLTRSKSKRQINVVKKSTKSVPKVQINKKQKSASKIIIKKKKVKKQKPASGYTQQQQLKFKQLRNKYMEMTIDKLKSILSANNQPKTGTKGDLIEKCADGELLGRIPLCSACGGGKLRFDRRTGNYKCPGYMDDVDFVHCSKFYTFSEVVRQPWSSS